MALTKLERRKRIKLRIRSKITGEEKIPRLSVFRSNKQFYAQFIDDSAGKTLLSVSSLEKGIKEKKNIKKTDQAKEVGKLAAEKALAAGIKVVKFDRNGYLYHGRVKAFADAAREAGLKL